jgi:cytochrome c nitrite reductase small subunit
MHFWSMLTLLPLILSAMLGLLLGVGSFTVYYAEGMSYFSNDPTACANCHIMRDHFDGWQKASHHQAATCNDCHVPHEFVLKYLAKAENGFWHSKGFTLQDFPEPIRIRPKNRAVLQENCVACHAELVSQIATHPGNDQQMLACLQCHAGVGHGPVR